MVNRGKGRLGSLGDVITVVVVVVVYTFIPRKRHQSSGARAEGAIHANLAEKVGRDAFQCRVECVICAAGGI